MAKGYSKKECLDYTNTFSPVAKMVTVRCVIAVVAHSGWSLYQTDVHNAFLEGDLVEEIYMTIPPSFSKDAALQGE